MKLGYWRLFQLLGLIAIAAILILCVKYFSNANHHSEGSKQCASVAEIYDHVYSSPDARSIFIPDSLIGGIAVFSDQSKSFGFYQPTAGPITAMSFIPSSGSPVFITYNDKNESILNTWEESKNQVVKSTYLSDEKIRSMVVPRRDIAIAISGEYKRSRLIIVDLTSRKIIASSNAPEIGGAIVLSKDHLKAYAVSEQGVFEVNVLTKEINFKSLDLRGLYGCLSIDPEGRQLAIATIRNKATFVETIDLDSVTVSRVIALPSDEPTSFNVQGLVLPESLIFGPDGKVLFALHSTTIPGKLSVIDLGKTGSRKIITLKGGSPRSLAISANGLSLYTLTDFANVTLLEIINIPRRELESSFRIEREKGLEDLLIRLKRSIFDANNADRVVQPIC